MRRNIKIMKRRAAVLAAAILGAVGSISASAMHNREESAGFPSGDTSDTSLPDGYGWKAAGNEKIELFANSDGRIAVRDKETGALYHSNPQKEDETAAGVHKTNLKSQLYVTWADREGNTTTKNSLTDCVNKGWLTWEPVPDGIRYYYEFQGAGITVPVEYTLTGDGFEASVLIKEIKEEKEGITLTGFSLLPYFAAADSETEGYSLAPDGSGALIRHNNEKASYGAYSQKIYGRDLALITEKMSAPAETARLPVFGMKNGETGFLAVITQGDSNAAVNAMTAGAVTSFNHAYVSFTYRPFTKTTFLQGNLYAGNGAGGDTAINLTLSPVAPSGERFSVRYVLLSGENTDYVGMARAYRDYLTREKGLKKAETTQAALCVKLLGGVTAEDYVLGFRVNVFRKLTTFRQAREILAALIKAGADSLAVEFAGWQPGGLESEIPAGISFERGLGGEKEYGKLAEFARERGIQFYMDFDFVNLYESGNRFSRFRDAAQTVGSTPAYQYTYDQNLLTKRQEGRWNILTPKRLGDAVGSMLSHSEKLAGAGISLSTLGSSIYSDYTHKSNGIDRSDAAGIWQDVFRKTAESGNRIMVEGGNAYALPYADFIAQAPADSSEFDIEDETVPFYQIVLRGMVPMSGEPLNLSGDPERQILKAAETGTGLTACLMYADSRELSDTLYNYIFSGNYKTWIGTISEACARLKEVLRLAGGSAIADHEKLAENVYRTVYENGLCVYVNYNAETVTVQGVTIAGKDFYYVR